MEQDLFNWLNSNHNNNNGTGLILAPLDVVPPDENFVDAQKKSTASETIEKISNADENFDDVTETADDENFIDVQEESTASETIEKILVDNQKIPITDENFDDVTETADDENFIDVQEESTASETIEKILVDNQKIPTAENFDDVQEEPQTPLSTDHDWQERVTGFTLSLDEPPPELWTHINDDDEDLDYEETDSLQGAAYVQIHGRNFTERLHHAMKHRKERAEREGTRDPVDSSRIYIQRTIIFCATLLMTLGFAVLALWFVWRETPEGMKSRALSLEENGKFDEAAKIYQRAYRRYPDDTEFLAELSAASEKAGHVQTAKTAHDEYIRIISEDSKTPVEIKTVPLETKPVKPVKTAMTFTDFLDEANHSYNIGMYNRSVIYFFRAHEANPDDIRPYIGLSNAYRVKGMYFDSKRILDEARIKFRRNPDIETGYIFLREEKR